MSPTTTASPRWALALGAALSVALAPNVALACPNCFVTSEQARMAYIGTTVFLSLTPLLLAGAFAYWLHGRVRDRAEEQGRSSSFSS